MAEKLIGKYFSYSVNARASSLPASTASNWFSSNEAGKSRVLKKGWLEKQSKNIFSPWKSKWVVLTEIGLSCYENELENSSTAVHTLLLNKDLLEVNIFEYSSKDPEEFSANSKNNNNNNKYIFKIFQKIDNKQSSSQSSKNVDTYAAKSDGDRKGWVQMLKKVMFGHLGGAIFGASLCETLQHERKRQPERVVPEVVEMCCNFLLQYGLQVEGLFRHSCRKLVLVKLREEFDRGLRPSFLPSSDNDDNTSPSQETPSSEAGSNVHLVTSLLKSYLLELPEPIVPVSFYDPIMTIVTRQYSVEPQESLKKLASIITQLPPSSYNLLRYLCGFLKVVGLHETSNKMTHLNLAKVFCNAVLQPEIDDPALLMGTADNRATAVCLMISHVEELLGEDYKTPLEDVRELEKEDDEANRDLVDLENDSLNRLVNFLPILRRPRKADQTSLGGDVDMRVKTGQQARKNRRSLLLTERVEENDELCRNAGFHEDTVVKDGSEMRKNNKFRGLTITEQQELYNTLYAGGDLPDFSDDVVSHHTFQQAFSSNDDIRKVIANEAISDAKLHSSHDKLPLGSTGSTDSADLLRHRASLDGHKDHADKDLHTSPTSREARRRMIRSALLSPHECLTRRELIHLCVSLKHLLAHEHCRTVYLQGQLNELRDK